MRLGGKEDLRRWAAPVGVLLVLTIAVVVIQHGLAHSGGGSPPVFVPTTFAPTATARVHTLPATTTATAAVYYTVASGDTYGSIASHYGTTVQELEALNPGVSSTALVVGQQIRVK